MKVIVHADDFGLDADTTVATIECFRNGWLTSASLMPKMPQTVDAIRFARGNPQYSYGVHLTYVRETVESPFCGQADIRSVLAPDGAFMESNPLRGKVLRGKLSAGEIALETEAQLAFMRDHGVRISHVDSHGHLHKFGPFREALRIVLPRFGIRRVRLAQNVYLRPQFYSPTYWFRDYWNRQIRRDWTTTDFFYMHKASEPENWWDTVARLLTRPGTLEVGVHPGKMEPWRVHEYHGAAMFTQLCRGRSVELITWDHLQ